MLPECVTACALDEPRACTRARGFLKTAMACVGGKSDGQVIIAQVESGVTWSKPTHVPLARAHWVRVGVGVRVRVRVRVRVG